MIGCKKENQDDTIPDFIIKTPGYFFDDKEQKTELPADTCDTKSNYKICIHRNFTDSKEKMFIEFAESLFPDRDSIFSDIYMWEEIQYDGSLWWYGTFWN